MQIEKTIEEISGIKTGTQEYSSLEKIHRGYNKLNGYDAMFEIIKRYRIVLYPFIALSILGSTYSFFNDFSKAFNFIDENILIFFSLIFSLMMEIVRDGSIIALFNSKMKIASRLTISIIFFVVTTFMFQSHFKAIKVIEQKSIEFELAKQTTTDKAIINPQYKIDMDNLNTTKKRIETLEIERAKQLEISANAKYNINKTNAQNAISKIDFKLERMEENKKNLEATTVNFDLENIKNIEDKTKLISGILLTTLIIIEALAMLGAVIKFIYKDNSEKEIARNSEIVEEYVNISSQLQRGNELLLSTIGEHLKISTTKNAQIAKMLFDAQNQNPHKKQTEIIEADVEQKPIGFKLNLSEKEIVERLFDHGNITHGKLKTKEEIMGKPSRSMNDKISMVYKKLEDGGAISRHPSKGYFVEQSLNEALKIIL